MIHASLFSGIGGPEVAAKMMGWENAFHCEINPFGRAVLDYWFPESESYEDITKTSFKEWRGRIDVLTGGFPCQPFSYAGKRGGGERTSVTSGRKCSALLTKSGPLGLSVRMLLESPLWWKEGYVLTWEAKPLCSRRVTNFTDTNLTSPTPSNASAKTLSISDIPSSRCLFRLRLLAHPTEETGSSSSRTMMLITPTSVQMTDPPEKMKERKEKNGYRNGTTYTSLETQVKYDPRCASMLPTPTAMDNVHPDAEIDATTGRRIARNGNATHSQGLSDLAHHGLLPTPLAVDVSHKKRVEANKKSGVSFKSRENGDARPNGLTDFLQFHGMLPTPRTSLYKVEGTDLNNPNIAQRSKGKRNDSIVKRIVNGEIPTDYSPNTDGTPFRLSPLFTEEMMGFPFLWTTLPFLKRDGGLNH